MDIQTLLDPLRSESPSEKFLSLVKGWGEMNPQYGYMCIISFPNGRVILELVDDGDKRVTIDSIESEPQNSGMGSTVMERLCDLADQLGVTLALEPWDYEDEEIENGEAPDLRYWYGKFGFVENSMSDWMTRKPS